MEVQLTATPERVRSVLPDLDDISDIRVTGDVLRYRTAQPQHTNPAVIEALVRAGCGVISVAVTTQTLEDVYAGVVGQQRSEQVA